VQRQLGHASIQLTVDIYGKWLPMGNKAAVNRLDDQSGSKVVAKSASGTPDVLEVPDSIGGPWRTRTSDPLIKSLRTLTPHCNPLQANSAIELHFALSKLG